MENILPACLKLTDLDNYPEINFDKVLISRLRLQSLGLKTPETLIITPKAFNDFINYNNLYLRLRQMIANCDATNPDQLASVTLEIKKHIRTQPLPVDLHKLLSQAYLHYFGLKPVAYLKDPLSAVKLKQVISYQGDTSLIVALRHLWASNITPNTILSELQTGHGLLSTPNITVTAFYDAQITGYFDTMSPILEQKHFLHLSYLSGSFFSAIDAPLLPSSMILDRYTGKIISHHSIKQTIKLACDSHGTVSAHKLKSNQNFANLSRESIGQISNAANQIQSFFASPQHVCFQIIDSKIIFWSSTNLEILYPNKSIKPSITSSLTKIGSGTPSSAGINSGPLKPIHSQSDFKAISTGDIIYLTEFKSSYVPYLSKVSGIIIQKSSPLSHLSILARELSIPSIVNTTFNPSVLPKNSIVTVNGATGEIFLGGITKSLSNFTMSNPKKNSDTPSRCATKIISYYSSVVEDQTLLSVSGLYFKNVLSKSALIQKISSFLAASGDRPCFYQLEDSPQIESNPLLSLRGINRILRDTSVIKNEIIALDKALKINPVSNFSLVVPFVRFSDEFVAFKKILSEHGWHRSTNRKLFITLDTPGSLLDLDRLIKHGLDGVIVNYDHLIPLSLGLDPNDASTSDRLISENSSIITLTEYVLKVCHEFNLPIFFSGYVIEKGHYLDELVRGNASGVIISQGNFASISQRLSFLEGRFIQSKT